MPIPIGTLTKKIHSQPNPSVSAPPTSGPTATAPPIVAPQAAIAVPRSGPWNSCAISASEVANIAAPPMPCRPAREVQEGRAGRQPAEQRREREQPDPDHEQPPPAEAVGERAHGQGEGGERQRVGVDHPLQPGEVGVELLLDVGQRDVDDGDVEQQHERRQADREQAPPLTLHQSPVRSVLPSVERQLPGRARLQAVGGPLVDEQHVRPGGRTADALGTDTCRLPFSIVR